MTHEVRRDAFVAADQASARRAVQRFVAERGLVAVRPGCVLPVLRTEIVLARDVIVTLAPVADGWRVHWSPADDGAFPRFTGTLAVELDGGDTLLRLAGEYEGPPTAFADTKDAEIGVRLVHATATAMLETLTKIVARA
jgi:hypothetical protein